MQIVSRIRIAGLLLAAHLPVIAQEPLFRDIRVSKEPGQPAGVAQVTVNGKVRQVSRHALQAWPVMGGQNALILSLNTKNAQTTGEYHLLFCEGATRKRRDLGAVPFASAELEEKKQSGGLWAFLLHGRSGQASYVIVADLDGIHGRLEADNSAKPLQALLASDMTGIYATTATGALKPEYVQFLRDGSAALLEPGGQLRMGGWWTDGDNMTVELSNAQKLEWPRTSLTRVDGVPAGTRLVVRLLEPLASNRVKEGDSVKAVLISPASIDGKILIPQGSEFDGTITKAHGVGWALKHETAALTVVFGAVKLPDGETLAIHTQLHQVENSREKVNDKGSIQGIRSTGTLGYSAETKVASAANVDPVAYLFSTVSATASLGFAEPEILYPAGTELGIELTAPLVTSKIFPPSIAAVASSPQQQQNLTQFVRKLPFRTMTKGSNKPSDLTNLAFIGSLDSVQRAFKAAGWVSTDVLNASSTFQTFKSIGGNQTYNQAPMSVLLLDERPPVLTLSKTTNTFSSRHHIRVFDPVLQYEGTRALTASSTQDIGIAFSAKQKTFIHVIDQYIDNERSKVINDLEFTGCVEGAQLVARPWVPQDAYNSTGDKLRTDGAIAVLRIGDCLHPKTVPPANAVPPNRFERVTRDTVLTLKNDVWRGNLGYQGVQGTIWLRNYFVHKDDLKPEEGAWRKTDVSGAEFKGTGSVPVDQQPSAVSDTENKEPPSPTPSQVALEQAHRWDPPRYEIGVMGGYLRYPHTRYEMLGAFLVPTEDVNEPTWDVGFQDEIRGGWSVGVFVTANTWRWVSNEFGYHYQHGTFLIGTYFANLAAENEQGQFPAISTQPVGLVTRQFEYNVLVHSRRPESRWRPYVAIGPALELIALADSPVTKAPKPFLLGLQNIGVLLAAFDFGSTPALDGGGIWELGLQYGAGIKFRIHPRITLSADFRETWAKNPEFIRSSYTASYFVMEGYTPRFLYGSDSTSNFRQQRFTLGIAYSF